MVLTDVCVPHQLKFPIVLFVSMPWIFAMDLHRRANELGNKRAAEEENRNASDLID
jgi:hypothetical protein